MSQFGHSVHEKATSNLGPKVITVLNFVQIEPKWIKLCVRIEFE